MVFSNLDYDCLLMYIEGRIYLVSTGSYDTDIINGVAYWVVYTPTLKLGTLRGITLWKSFSIDNGLYELWYNGFESSDGPLYYKTHHLNIIM